LDRLAAAAGNVLGALQRAQAVDRGVDDVDGVRGAERLGQDVLDAGGLDHGPDGAAGDDAGSRRGGLQHDDGAGGLTEHLVGNGREHEGASNMDLRAGSDALAVAAGNSRALPFPTPTRPLPLPTATTSVNEKRRPPLP